MPHFAIDDPTTGLRTWLTGVPGVTGQIWDEGYEIDQSPKYRPIIQDGADWLVPQIFDSGNKALEVAFSTVGTFASYEDADDFRQSIMSVPAFGTLVRCRRVSQASVPTWRQDIAVGAFIAAERVPGDGGVSVHLTYKGSVPQWVRIADLIPSTQGVVPLSDPGDGSNALTDDSGGVLAS